LHVSPDVLAKTLDKPTVLYKMAGINGLCASQAGHTAP
jgi:hypothetical protein